jgi:hypothetical protein
MMLTSCGLAREKSLSKRFFESNGSIAEESYFADLVLCGHDVSEGLGCKADFVEGVRDISGGVLKIRAGFFFPLIS